MLSIVFQIFQLALAAVCIVEGVRSSVLTGLSRQKMYFLILGVLICFGNATRCYLDYRFQSHGLSLLVKKLDLPYVSRDWGAEFSVEHRARASREAARIVFEQNGELRNYFDSNGDYLVFAPTQREMEARENVILQLNMVEKHVFDSWNGMINWLVLLAISFVLGGAWGLAQKHRTRIFFIK